MLLWVNEQRPPASVVVDDGVLYGETVVRKVEQGPLSHLYRVAQDADEAEVSRVGDLSFFANLGPLVS